MDVADNQVSKSFDLEVILAENERRKASLEQPRYDPLLGIGCWGDRQEVDGRLVPKAVLQAAPDYVCRDPLAQDRLRIVEDFEFWCARCVTIQDKLDGRKVPFVLNPPQRRLLAVMENQRAAGRPVRVILLKARQWGGSTLVQMYLAWMQIVRHKGWNSLICGHIQANSKGIKRMYNLMLRNYPTDLLEDGERLRFTKLEGQPNVQQIEQRECLVITGSALSEDAVRGYDIAMAHLSEVAHWKSSVMHSPDNVVRSVCGSVVLKPETVVVMESTAKGVGDYFHDEWLRAVAGRSDKEPVFVPWYEIPIYTQPVDDVVALWQSMDDYERHLWNDGRTLEQVNWYHLKRLEYRTQEFMMAEYPSSAGEAFTASGINPFDRRHLDRLEEGCRLAPCLVGDIMADGRSGLTAKRNIRLVEEVHGRLKVWHRPVTNSPVKVKYLVVVDVGGRADSSDYSVIAVWRWNIMPQRPEVVAQWRGHIDHDELAWKAMQLAKYYNNALLAIESNTITNEEAREGESEFIFEKLREVYGAIYQRKSGKMGFHTNVKTKSMAVAELISAVRDNAYVEHDIEAVNEMRTYEEHNGRYAARPGKHDDILMTRAIGLYIMQDARFKTNCPVPDAHSLNKNFMPAQRIRPSLF